jgi:hypothetical protein
MIGGAATGAGSARSPRTSREDETASATRLDDYFALTRKVSVSLFFLAPLLVGYEIAVACLDGAGRGAMNAEVRDLLWYLGPAAAHFRAFLLALCAVGACAALLRHERSIRLYPSFLVESLLYALLLGPLALLLTTLGATALAAPAGPPDGRSESLGPALLSSIGAGIYEELTFRLMLIGGGLIVLERLLAVRRAVALPLLIVASALIFAQFHHLGPHGEPADAHRFWFRTVAGIILGSVFVLRGLGVAVYLHALYDVIHDLRLAMLTN